MKKILALIFLSVFLLPAKVNAVTDHVVINELMPHPSPGPDWVELYNPTNSNVDIGGWVITDSSINTINIPSSTILNAKEFAYYTFSNKLNNGGDTVKVKESEGSTSSIDEKEYLADPGINISIGRSPDGEDNWVTFNMPTPGSSNNPVTPTPTSTPTSSPEATIAPTPTVTVTPTSTPTPTILPSPSSTIHPTPTPINFQEIFEKRMVCRFSYNRFKRFPNADHFINLLKIIFGPQSVCPY